MTSTDQLFERLNGHDLRDAVESHSNANRSVVITKPSQMPRLGWLRRTHRGERGGKPGGGMIVVATGLLFLLGAGLLAVSLSAQYSYLYRQRHQSATSLVEALALDVGMLIFSLLALGLARSGKPAKVERILIMVCAAGSAGMNFAAANDASPRSILAYTMPPVFLAIVADRVISVVRRHFLGDEEASAWAGFGRAALYGLRFTVAAPSTLGGARRALLTATPLPAIEAPPAQDQDREDAATAWCGCCGQDIPAGADGSPAAHIGPLGGPTWCPGGSDGTPEHLRPVACACGARVVRDPFGRLVAHQVPGLSSRPWCPEAPVPDDTGPNPRQPREGTKTAAFLALVKERHGDLATFPLESVSRVAGELAPEVDLNEGSARRELRSAVLAAQDGSAA